jgi:hypothetical protein
MDERLHRVHLGGHLKSDPLFEMGLPRGSGEESFDGPALSVRLNLEVVI